MVSEIRIYAEGAGDSKDSKAFFRQGLSAFLDELRGSARQKKIGWTVVACGPRQRAFEDFKTALTTHGDAFNVLLVDSEAPVQKTPWLHLEARDGWSNLGTSDEHCHLMVQTMEAWFIADRESLARFYGQGFNANSFPGGDVEIISKQAVNAALHSAARATQKGEYHKVRHGCKLLELIDPAIVRQASTYCDRIFFTLLSKLQS